MRGVFLRGVLRGAVGACGGPVLVLKRAAKAIRGKGYDMNRILRYTEQKNRLALRRQHMDPLWVLVILIGGSSLVVAIAFVFIAFKVADVARQVAPTVTEMEKQLSAAGVEIAMVSEAVRSAETQFNGLADRASTASRRVTKVVDVVPRAIHVVRNVEIKAEATVRAVGVVAVRTVQAAHERALSSHEVTLK